MSKSKKNREKERARRRRGLPGVRRRKTRGKRKLAQKVHKVEQKIKGR